MERVVGVGVGMGMGVSLGVLASVWDDGVVVGLIGGLAKTGKNRGKNKKGRGEVRTWGERRREG